MTIKEILKEYTKFCSKQKSCEHCKYNIYPCELFFAYDLGRTEAEKELQGLKDLGKFYSEIRAEVRAEVIEKCAKVVSSMVGICQSSCPIGCQWGTEESCVESWKIYLNEQLKEQNNE